MLMNDFAKSYAFSSLTKIKKKKCVTQVYEIHEPYNVRILYKRKKGMNWRVLRDFINKH